MKFELKVEDRVKDAHLKSCPFCGQNAYAYDGTIYPMVKCSSCNAVLYAYVDETVEDMCHRWNQRKPGDGVLKHGLKSIREYAEQSEYVKQVTDSLIRHYGLDHGEVYD